MNVKCKDGKVIQLKIAELADFKGTTFDSMYAWYQQIDEDVFLSFDPKNYRLHKQLLQSQLANKNIVLIIGIHEQKIIAQVSLFQNEPRVFQKINHIAGFFILVHPYFQDNGLGTEMVKIIENIAILKGIKKLEITCMVDNERALHVYEKLGYLREGYHPKSVQLKNGKQVAKISLGKQLVIY